MLWHLGIHSSGHPSLLGMVGMGSVTPGYSHWYEFVLQQSWKKQNFSFHRLISHNDKAVPGFHKSTFHCSHLRPFQSFLAQPVSLLTPALFSRILHFILLSSSFLKCQGEHLSSLHHKETQRHLSTRGCVSQMPATFHSQNAAYLQAVYSVWGNTLHTEPF